MFVAGLVGAGTDAAVQIATSMIQGKSFTDSVKNIKPESLALSFVGGMAGAGIAKNAAALGSLFSSTVVGAVVREGIKSAGSAAVAYGATMAKNSISNFKENKPIGQNITKGAAASAGLAAVISPVASLAKYGAEKLVSKGMESTRQLFNSARFDKAPLEVKLLGNSNSMDLGRGGGIIEDTISSAAGPAGSAIVKGAAKTADNVSKDEPAK
jgi:hypothetical protein